MNQTDDRTALRDLRRTRQRHRLGDTEWFDVAYRVYLFALVGLIGVVLASDAIGGLIGDDVTTADLLTRGPSLLGIAVVAAIGLGLRSGANGGPVSVEVPDVIHLLLAPISRRRVLLRPVAQRIRSAMFALALPGAIVGQFVAREVEGSRASWAAAGAMFGAVSGAAFVSSAVLSHSLRLPRWAATIVSAALLGWQTAAAWATWNEADSALRAGPANLAGSLALWGIRQRSIDLVAIAFVIVAVGAALALSGRLRIEPLVRRGRLVSQLRFAATVQDLRTVVLLRRQLRAETLRSTPWGGSPRVPVRSRSQTRATSLHTMIWTRGFRSLRRLPAARLGRIAALAATAGISGSLAVSSSLLFLLGLLATLFLLGMETIEPLSQEIDRPERTDGLPIDRGLLYAHHLVAPAALLAGAAIIAAATASMIRPSDTAAAWAITIPTLWAGALGPVIATVLDSSTPIAVADTTLIGAPRDTDASLVPPEFASFSSALSTFIPVAISAIGVIPVLAMRSDPSAATAGRIIVGIALVWAAAVTWILRRDRWGVKIRAFFEAGRDQKAAATS